MTIASYERSALSLSAGVLGFLGVTNVRRMSVRSLTESSGLMITAMFLAFTIQDYLRILASDDLVNRSSAISAAFTRLPISKIV